MIRSMIISEQKLHNRTIMLDGCMIRSCHFINCDLRYMGGDGFALSGNSYEGFFNLEFSLASENAFDLLRAVELDLTPWDIDLTRRARRWWWSLNRRYPFRYHTLLRC